MSDMRLHGLLKWRRSMQPASKEQSMYSDVLVEMLVHSNVQEILTEAAHDRIARQAPTQRPLPLVTLASRLHGLAVGIGHFASRAGAAVVPATNRIPDAGPVRGKSPGMPGVGAWAYLVWDTRGLRLKPRGAVAGAGGVPSAHRSTPIVTRPSNPVDPLDT
jgi:hypothetical protein